MSDPQVSERDPGFASPEELNSALFAHLVMQQSNMALMLLGKAPHPETGQTVQDLEGAKLFIDQLEMLEAKTKGNLSKEESAMLKQTLMSLRFSFVQAVESAPPKTVEQSRSEAAPSQPGLATETAKAAPAASTVLSGEDEEHRKKFTKKY